MKYCRCSIQDDIQKGCHGFLLNGPRRRRRHQSRHVVAYKVTGHRKGLSILSNGLPVTTSFLGSPPRANVLEDGASVPQFRVERFHVDVAVCERYRRLVSRRHANQQRTAQCKKGKVFPYSLPSVGPGADPGVQAVSPQVT